MSKINEQIADKIESEINDKNLTFKPRVNQNPKLDQDGKTFLQRQKLFDLRKSGNISKIEN
jgi:hypothetical protein